MTSPSPAPPTVGGSNQRTPEELALAEMKNQKRLVDQMTTGHSLLRDRYRSRATIMTCSLLSASVLATAFAFASGDADITIGEFSASRSTLLGWFAVVTFAATLIDLVLDWRGRQQKHEDAVRQLAVLKAEYQTTPEAGEELATRDRLSQRYQAVMDSVPNVPDRQFVHLKAAHLQKVEISRLLSEFPGMTVRQARRELRRRIENARSNSGP